MGNKTDDIFIKNSMRKAEDKNNSTDGIFTTSKKSTTRLALSDSIEPYGLKKTTCRVYEQGFLEYILEENPKEED